MSISGSQKAYKYAMSGVMRSGTSRSNYTSPYLFVSIAGVHYATGRASASQAVLENSLTVTQNLDDIPDTCAFRVRGFTPSDGQEVIVTIGSKNNLDRYFGGIILNDTHAWSGAKSTFLDQVNAVDFTWMLDRHKINKRYLSMSATAIALDIMVGAPTGFTTYGVQTGLATLDEFTLTNVTRIDALRRLAKRIGGYVDVSPLKDIKFGTSDESGTNPVDLTSAHTSLMNFSVQRDMSQMVTRVFVEGGGVNALTTVAVGETIIPVADASWYSSSGGTVACGPQRIAYGSALEGGGGSLVGVGIGPPAAPAAIPAAGSGVETGYHDYAFTFVTASGESLPSPVASVQLGGGIGNPKRAPTGGFIPSPNPSGPYPFTAGDAERWWAYTLVTAAGETLPSPIFVPISGPLGAGGPYYFSLGLPTGPTGTTDRKIYRTVAGGSQLKLVGAVGNNTAIFYSDHVYDASLGANAPTVNTADVGNQAALSGIAIGGTGVTSRKLYRTVNGVSVAAGTGGAGTLKLLTTIANNTATTYTDSTPDASLGALAPTSDTSGLAQPTGQVNAGSTSLEIAGTGAFSSTGGWAIIGNGQQIIRYTGISGNTLTGIPVIGDGAITASVSYNSTVTAAPSLANIPTSGEGAIIYAILPGDPVNLLVRCDDSVAQALVASLIGGTEDGVIEDYIQDGRLSETEARARGSATLALRSTLHESVEWVSQDTNTRAGRTATVNYEGVVDSFKIQSVTISNFCNVPPASPNLPTFTANGSDQRYTFEDLLRQMQRPGDHIGPRN